MAFLRLNDELIPEFISTGDTDSLNDALSHALDFIGRAIAVLAHILSHFCPNIAQQSQALQSG